MRQPRSERPLRLAVIQEILSPVRRPVFEIMAGRDDIALKIFMLSKERPDRPGWVVRETEAFDVEFVRTIGLKAHMKTPGGRAAVDNRSLAFPLSWKVAKWRPDAVFFGGVTQFVFLLPLKLFRRVPFVLGVADTEVTASQYPVWKQRLRAFAYRQADTYVPYGEAAMRYLNSIGISKERMFHGMWSVDNALYDSLAARIDRRPGEPLRWISVGRLVPGKGFSELIDAWAAQGPAFLRENSLWIVGEGPSRLDLEQRLRKRSLSGTITLLGHKTPEELAVLYRQCDAFVFPTLMDTWGLVVNEAMATGLPILCSAYAGCHLDLVGSENGVVFDPLDAQAFAQTIDDFWRDRNRWTEMGAASRRIVSEYTFKATANAILRAAKAAVSGVRNGE